MNVRAREGPDTLNVYSAIPHAPKHTVRRITVSVEPAEGPPIDLEAWARLFARTMIGLYDKQHGEAPADEGRIGA